MGVQPPHPFDAESASVTVRSDFDSEITTMSVSGRWSTALWRRSSVTVRKCLSERPRGLVIDLHGLHDPLARSEPTWLNAYRRGVAMDPPVLVAVCSPDGKPLTGRLRRGAIGRYLPLFAEAGAAQQALASGLGCHAARRRQGCLGHRPRARTGLLNGGPCPAQPVMRNVASARSWVVLIGSTRSR